MSRIVFLIIFFSLSVICLHSRAQQPERYTIKTVNYKKGLYDEKLNRFVLPPLYTWISEADRLNDSSIWYRFEESSSAPTQMIRLSADGNILLSSPHMVHGLRSQDYRAFILMHPQSRKWGVADKRSGTMLQPFEYDTIFTVEDELGEFPDYEYHVYIKGNRFFLSTDDVSFTTSGQLVYRIQEYGEKRSVLKIIPADPHAEYRYTQYMRMFNGSDIPFLSGTSLNAVRKDQCWGLMNEKGDVKLGFAYDSILPLDPQHYTFALYRNGKKGYYKSYASTWASYTHEFFYEPENDSISDIGWYTDHHFDHAVKVRNKWRLAAYGKYFGRGRYDSIVISELAWSGIYYARKGRKWAPVSSCAMHLNKKHLTIKERVEVYRCLHHPAFKWDSIGTIDRSNAISLVKKHKRSGLVNSDGKSLTSPKWSLILCPVPGKFEFYSRQKEGVLYLRETRYWDKKTGQLKPAVQ